MALGVRKTQDPDALRREGKLRPLSSVDEDDPDVLMRAGKLKPLPMPVYSPSPESLTPPEAPPPEEPDGRHPFKYGMEAAGTQLTVGLPYGVEKAIGTLTPEKENIYAQKLRESAARREALLPGGPMQLGEVKSPLDVPRFVYENVAVSTPQMGATVGGTLAGAAAGTLVEPGGGTVLGAIAGAAPTIGGIAASAPIYVGSNVERSTDSGQNLLTQGQAQRSLGWAPVQGALDVLPEKFLPVVGNMLPGPKFAPKGGLVGKTFKTAAAEGATEFVAEPAQTFGERSAAGLPTGSPDALEEYKQAALTGGAVGAAMGTVTGPFHPHVETEGERRKGKGKGTVPAAEPTTEATPEIADAGYDVQFGYGKYGDPNFKPTEKTMGEVYDYGRNVLIPNTKGKLGRSDDLGTSAIGKYQMTGATMKRMAEKLYGAGWRDIDFTPEVQETLARQLFEETKGGNLQAQWASLPDATPGAYANVPWEQMREIISQHEGTAKGGAYATADGAPAGGTETAEAGPPATSDEDLAEMAKRLRGEDTQATATVPGMPDVPATSAQTEGVMADVLQGQEDQVARAQAEEGARGNLLKKVLDDPRTTDPTKRFVALMKRNGFSDISVRPEERQAILAHGLTQGLDTPTEGMTPEPVAAAQEQAAPAAEAAPEAAPQLTPAPQAVVEAAPAPAPTPAAPAEQIGPERQRQLDNIKARLETHISDLSRVKPDQAAWVRRGAETELGLAEHPTPPGKQTGPWFEQGREWARKEKAHQERETPAPEPAARTQRKLKLPQMRMEEVPAPAPAAVAPAPAPAPAPAAPAAPPKTAKAITTSKAKAPPKKVEAKAPPKKEAPPKKAPPKKAAKAIETSKAKAPPKKAAAPPPPKKEAPPKKVAPPKETKPPKETAPPKETKPKKPTKAQVAAEIKAKAEAARAARREAIKVKPAVEQAVTATEPPRRGRPPKSAPVETRPAEGPPEAVQARQTRIDRLAAEQAERDAFFRQEIDKAVDKSEISGQVGHAIEAVNQNKLANGEFATSLDDVRHMLEEAKAQQAKAKPRAAPASNITEDDIDPNIHAVLTEDDKDHLAAHYNRPTWDATAARKFQADVVRAINHGIQTIARSIRGIVTKAAAVALSLHLVFNPSVLTQANTQFHEGTAQAATIEHVLDEKTQAQLSENAKIVMSDLEPQLGKGKYAGKAVVLADKPGGRIYVFDGKGKLAYQGSALFGAEAGDVLKVGGKVTPSGEYRLGMRTGEKGYDTGVIFPLEGTERSDGVIAIHSVWLGDVNEKREARLATQEVSDNKVSFGCINTAKADFASKILPMADQMNGGVAIVVPDVPIQQAAKAPAAPTPAKQTPAQMAALPMTDKAARAVAAGRARRDRRRGLTPEQKKWARILERARTELDRVGLSEVGVQLVDELHGGTAAAEYQGLDEGPFGHLIKMALSHGARMSDMNHEVVHALREMNLFTDAEWDALVAKAKESKARVEHIEDLYADEPVEVQEEEMVAELYRDHSFGRTSTSGLISRLIARINDVFYAIGRALRGSGVVTGRDVLNLISSGEVGARERGATRGELGIRAGKEGQIMARQRRTANEAKRTSVEHAKSAVNAYSNNLVDQGRVWLAPTKDMARMYRDVLPDMQKIVELHSNSHAIARKFQERIVDTKDLYHAVEAKYQGTMPGSISEFLHDSTMSDMWGFKPDFRPSGALTEDQKAFYDALEAKAIVDPELAKRFEAMPDNVQQVIKNVFRINYDARNELNAAGAAAISAEYDPEINDPNTKPDDRAALVKQKQRALREHSRIYDTRDALPYTPLKREGNWAVVGKSEAYRAAEKAKDYDTLDELRKQAEHYFVNFYDSIWEAEKAEHDVRQQFGADGTYRAPRGDPSVTNMVTHGEPWIAFKQMQKYIETDFEGSDRAKKEMQRVAREFFAHSVSEHSALKGELKREKVSGKNPVTGEVPDMMKAFANRGDATANFVASIRNSGEMQASLRRLKEQLNAAPASQRENLQRTHNEFMMRLTTTMGRQPTRLADKVMKGVSIYTLLSSPFYYFQNATQTALITQPKLASMFGYGQSAAAIASAYRTFLKGTRHIGLATRMDFKGIVAADPELADLMEYLANSGHLDAGYTEAINTWYARGDGILPRGWNLVDKFIRNFPQRIEVMNRTTAGIATYKLALEKGKSKAEAMALAGQIIDDTHGDYSGFNMPRAFSNAGGLVKVMLQFRKFQLIQLSLLTREFNRAFRGATPEERAMGRGALVFLFGHMAAIGGLVGLPGSALLGASIKAIMSALDPDDDKDWKDWRHDLRESIGAGKEGSERNMLADLLYKGAPYLLGIDTSERLGMGNALALAPYSGITEATESREKFYQAAGKIMLGPSGNVISGAINGWGWMEQGDWTRFAEGILPTGLAALVRAGRIANEGVRARGGEAYLRPEEISGGEVAATAFGVNPRQLANQAEKTSERFAAEEHYKALTTQLKRRWVRAVEDNDRNAKAEVRQEWDDVQKARKRQHIDTQPLSTLLKAPREQAKRQKHIIGGVPYDKADKDFVSSLALAPDEEAALADA